MWHRRREEEPVLRLRAGPETAGSLPDTGSLMCLRRIRQRPLACGGLALQDGGPPGGLGCMDEGRTRGSLAGLGPHTRGLAETAESVGAGVIRLMEAGPQRDVLVSPSRWLLPGAGGAAESCRGASLEAGGGQADRDLGRLGSVCTRGQGRQVTWDAHSPAARCTNLTCSVAE